MASDSSQAHVPELEDHNRAATTGWTARAVVSGLSIGVLINLSNTYYGLRTGSGGQMAMVSSLLGFCAVEALPGFRSKYTAVAENVLIVSIATATGCMPITAGFVGIIPALEYLIGPEENGPIPLSLQTLILWSVGLCFFGIIFAFLLRKNLVVKENLPWPGPKAAAQLLDTLHHVPSKPSAGSTTSDGVLRTNEPATTQPRSSFDFTSEMDWRTGIARLVWGGIISGILTILMYFVPVMHSLPVFGRAAADIWLWRVDFSPGFFGQGMITGPVIPVHMLIGAIVGWGILSPYAKSKGWAPGDVEDWATGFRGWIIWISLASLMADALVKLTWFAIQPIWNWHIMQPSLGQRSMRRESQSSDDNERQPFLSLSNPSFTDPQDDDETIGSKEHPLARSRITSQNLGVGFLFTVVICVSVIHMIFRQYVKWYYTLLSIALSLPMAVIGIRALAETDWNPESALISQLTFATIIPHSNPNGVIINLISAAIAQAGANQSGDIAYDFKIGHLLGAQPDVQAYGHILGSIFGALISCSMYKLYTSQYTIPGPLFPIPSSYLVLSTARLVMGQGLPQGVAPFAVAALLLSAAGTVVKMRYAHRWWQNLIPSGTSFAIGIYLVPSFSIVRALGGIFVWAYERRHRGSHRTMIIIASGLVLGESLASLVTLAFTALRVPHFAR